MDINDISTKLGKAVLKIRNRKRLSRRELSEISGVGETTMRDFENTPGYSITLNNLLALCKGLKISLEELLREADLLDTRMPPMEESIRLDKNLSEESKLHFVWFYRLLTKQKDTGSTFRGGN